MANKDKVARIFEDFVKQTQMPQAEVQKLWTECVEKAKAEGKKEDHLHFYPYVIAMIKTKAGLTTQKCEQLLSARQPSVPAHIKESIKKVTERYLTKDAKDKVIQKR